MKRRLAKYRKANEAPNGDPSICRFFDEYQNKEIEVKDIDIKGSDLFKVSGCMKNFIHRVINFYFYLSDSLQKGRYFAYLTREEEEKDEEDIKIKKEKKRKKDHVQLVNDIQNGREEANRKI